MKVIDPGHEYLLDSYDGEKENRLVFMKREGEGYPLNVGHHAGTNCQSTTRALIARTDYLNSQIGSIWNKIARFGYRLAIWAFEQRAARRHRRWLPLPIRGIENHPTCLVCGHIGCEGIHHG